MATEMGLPENDDLRRRAMVRLGVAALVTAAALGGLWWLDHSGTQKKTAPTPSAKPIVSAAPSEPPPVPAEATEPAVQAPSSAQAEPIMEPPPPPKVGLPATPPADLSKPPAPIAARPVAPATQPTQPPMPAPASPAVTAASGFVLQLGVFNNVERARELVEQLKKQGIQAQIETRVQVGPYLNRAEAEKAATELKKRGLNALLIAPTSRK